MPRTNSGPYVIFDTRAHRYFCLGLRSPAERGWHTTSAKATIFATRTEAVAGKASIQIFGRASRSAIAIIPAPKIAQASAENLHNAAEARA